MRFPTRTFTPATRDEVFIYARRQRLGIPMLRMRV
jgi:hypothetical protein